MAELADILRVAGPDYLQRHGDRMPPSHRRVLRDLVDCRTSVLGGRMFLCHSCGHHHPVYHSCRNRHCPKCQGDRAQAWLERQRERLLPSAYGLATCTLPAGLRRLARSRQRLVYSILISAAAHALLDLAGDRRFIGGLTAVMAVLHTWTRALAYHPHVHLLFPLGGLTGDDTWIRPRKAAFVLPSYGLAKRFRERVEAAFRAAGLYQQVSPTVWTRPWVAHVARVGSGEQALLYLSRYVFRVAISNRRILAFDGTRVTIATGRRAQTVTLTAHELIRRFLQHVLPRGFVKVRYYGLWAPTNRHKLATARTILENHLAAVGKPVRRRDSAPDPANTTPRCPRCGVPYRSPPIRIQRTRAPP